MILALNVDIQANESEELPKTRGISELLNEIGRNNNSNSKIIDFIRENKFEKRFSRN